MESIEKVSQKSAMAKYYASEIAVKAANDAVQIMKRSESRVG